MKTSLPLQAGVLALIGALSLGACGSSHKTSAGTSSSSTSAPATPPSSSSSSASSSSTAGTAADRVSTAPAGPPACVSSQLAGSLGASDGTLGTVYYPLVLTNRGSATCVLQGYAGVSFVAGSHGTQVGAAARRETGSAPSVTLTSGQSASATLGIVDASNFGPPCQSTPVLGLRVYPPGQKTALFISHTDVGCANPADVVLSIRPFTF